MPGTDLSHPRLRPLVYSTNVHKSVYQILSEHRESIPSYYATVHSGCSSFPYDAGRPFVIYFLALPVQQQQLRRQGGDYSLIYVEKLNAVGEKLSIDSSKLPDEKRTCGSLIALDGDDVDDIILLKERIRPHLNIPTNTGVWLIAINRKQHEIIDIENDIGSLGLFTNGNRSFTFGLQYDGGRLPPLVGSTIVRTETSFRQKFFRGNETLVLPAVHFCRPKTISTPTLVGLPFFLRLHAEDKVGEFKARLFKYMREHSQMNVGDDMGSDSSMVLDKDIYSNCGAILT